MHQFLSVYRSPRNKKRLQDRSGSRHMDEMSVKDQTA
jgi:hypothetical protein